jgi:hypothetical protein
MSILLSFPLLVHVRETEPRVTSSRFSRRRTQCDVRFPTHDLHLHPHHIRWYNWARTFSPLSQEAAVPFIDFADVKARVSIEEAAEKIGLNLKPSAGKLRWRRRQK